MVTVQCNNGDQVITVVAVEDPDFFGWLYRYDGVDGENGDFFVEGEFFEDNIIPNPEDPEGNLLLDLTTNANEELNPLERIIT